MKAYVEQDIEHDDDVPKGRILTRREILSLLAGGVGAVLLAACDSTQVLSGQPTTTPTTAAQPTTTPTTGGQSTTQPTPTVSGGAMPACVARPELTEGPYFVDEKINRSDIRSDPSDGSVKEGIQLQLAFRVSQISNNCTPLAGATVDVWHCDALGVYSDASDPGFNTRGQKFLRGYQVTDANGIAQFTTIYPGWYQGRAVHIHFKIRTDPNSQTGYEFTSQLFFDESITDQVHAQQPYAGKGYRTLKNEGDNIYRGGGSQLLLTPTKSGDGYAATLDIGLQIA